MQSDPIVTTAAFSTLELALQTALQWDTSTRNKLQDIREQVFLFECTQPVFRVYFFPETLHFQQHYEGPVTAHLSGTSQAFLALARADDAAAELINNPELQLRGDSRALVKLQEIIAQIDLDWEAPLIQIFGDVVGHQLASSLLKIHQQAKYSAKSLHRQIADFLREESGWLPAADEVKEFLHGVDNVSMRVDRANAALNLLRQKINNLGK